MLQLFVKIDNLRHTKTYSHRTSGVFPGSCEAKSSLIIRMKRSGAVLEYDCDECDRQFTTKQGRNRHKTMTHTKAKENNKKEEVLKRTIVLNVPTAAGRNGL